MATAQQVSRQPGKTPSGGVVRINLAGTRYPVGKEISKHIISPSPLHFTPAVKAAAMELGIIASDDSATDRYVCLSA